MPYTAVEESQFEFTDDGIRHRPTGAFFAIDPGQIMPKSVNWSRAGDVLENGDDYDRAEIQMIAEILLERRGPRAI
jgi:hypothetical protein